MARHLAEHSYDINTLHGYPVRFTDGCEGTVRNIDGRFALVASFPSQPHVHQFEYAWPTVAWSYIDAGKAFPATKG